MNAGLVLRDERVSGLSERSVSVLRGLLSGQTQRDIAESLGISPSAVSQRVRADGLAAIVDGPRAARREGGRDELARECC